MEDAGRARGERAVVALGAVGGGSAVLEVGGAEDLFVFLLWVALLGPGGGRGSFVGYGLSELLCFG